MPLDKSRLRLVRKRFAELYPTESSARRVAHDTGLALDKVNFQGDAQTFWFSILEEATKADHLQQLFRVVRYEYEDEELWKLVDAMDVELPKVPEEIVGAGARRQLLLVLGPRLGIPLVDDLLQRAGLSVADTFRDKPLLLLTKLQRQWPGKALAEEIVSVLERMDTDTRRSREIMLGALAQISAACFIVTAPERSFERVKGIDPGSHVGLVTDASSVRVGEVLHTRGNRSDRSDLERLLSPGQTMWVGGPPEAHRWRDLLARWFDEGQHALLVGFGGEQAAEVLVEMRAICRREEIAAHVLLDDDTDPASLPTARDRVIEIGEHGLAPVWIERLRDAIELRVSKDELRNERIKANRADYYGTKVEAEFDAEVRAVREALDASRFAEAKKKSEQLLIAAQERASVDRERWRSWEIRCRLNVATALLCLQEHNTAREMIAGVSNDDVALLSAKIQSTFAEQLAILGETDRAQEILSQLPEVPPEDLARVSVSRWRVTLMRGEVPEGPVPKGGHVQSDLAQHWLERGDLARCTEHALQSLEEEPKPLDRLNASRLLLIALQGTIIEDPPFVVAMPREIRSRVVEAIEHNLSIVTQCDPPFPNFRKVALNLSADFYQLSNDDERCEEARRQLRELFSSGSIREENEVLSKTFAHLSEGREELAHEMLSSIRPPWRRVQLWLAVLANSGQAERALKNALSCSREDRERGPMADLIAHLLLRSGRQEEALPYARRGFAELPVRGARHALAECLGMLRLFEEAWTIAAPLSDTGNPEWLRTLAVLASNLHRNDSVVRWRAVVVATPDSSRARMQLANELQERGQIEEAADEAWQCLALGLDEQLSPDDFYRIAVRQQMAGIAARTDRLRRIAEILGDRFPGDARAETLRFQVLAALDFPEGLPSVDYALLEGAGVMHRASVEDVVVQRRQRGRLAALTHLWYRLGNLTFDSFSKLIHIEPASLVQRFAEAALDGQALVSAAVRLRSELDSLTLRGTKLLLGHLELLILQRFKLLDTLRDSLGPDGAVVVFDDTIASIHESASRLEQSTQRVQLEECQQLLDQIHRSPAITVHKDVISSGDDLIWAFDHGVAIIDARSDLTPPTDAILLSPKIVAERLHLSGHIDALTHRRLLQSFQHDPGIDVLPDPLPRRVAITYASLVAFFDARALDSLAPLFKAPIIVGPETEALVRGRRDSLLRTVEAADLAKDLVRSMGAGRIERVERPNIELPPLPQSDETNDWQEESRREPIRLALAVHQVLHDRGNLHAVTADWFVWRPDSASDIWHALDWTNHPGRIEQSLRLLQQTQGRVWSFTDLLGPLGLGERENEIRLDLARMGFTDALTPDALLVLVRRFGALDGAVACRVLDSIEHMARVFHGVGADDEPLRGTHLGRVPAALAIASLYARTIAAMFAPAAFEPPVRTRVLGDLFGRLEALTQDAGLDVLGVAASLLANQAIHDLDSHIALQDSGARLRSDGPIFLAWQAAVTWAGTMSSRIGALARGYRRVALLTDGAGESAARVLVQHVLTSLADRNVVTGSVADLTRAPWRDLAVLSATWRYRPLAQKTFDVTSRELETSENVDCERLLMYGAQRLAAGSTDVAADLLETHFHASLLDGRVRLPVRSPSVALLLRIDGVACSDLARNLAQAVGVFDPSTQAALLSLAERPDDIGARRTVAHASLNAAWCSVRDDPTTLLLWSSDARRGFQVTPASISELRELLSEPRGPLPEGGVFDWLLARGRDGGCWSSRDDYFALHRRAASVPWPIFVTAHLDTEGGPDLADVSATLTQLSTPQELSIGELCANLSFLHRTSAQRRYIIIDGREIDLKEEISNLWLRALRSVVHDPSVRRTDTTATLADFEAALLRRCGRTVSDLKERFEPLSVRDGLWLTWQLYNWLVDVLNTLAPGARIEALETLARTAPAPTLSQGDNRDLWNPFSFDRFDYRLTALLHAFVIGHEIKLGAYESAIASEAIEELLIQIAQRPSTDFDDEVRSLGNKCSHFEWYVSGAVPDLALTALLSMKPEAFVRLPVDVRALWISRLPLFSGQPGRLDEILAGRVIGALVKTAGKLTRAEQIAFRDYLGCVETRDDDRTFAWKIAGLTALFSAGHDTLGELVRAGILLAPTRSITLECIGDYLMTRTRDTTVTSNLDVSWSDTSDAACSTLRASTRG